MIQNLKDAGCNETTISEVSEMYRCGQMSAVGGLLKRHRCGLMDSLHECQKRVDCLDFLLWRLERKKDDKDDKKEKKERYL